MNAPAPLPVHHGKRAAAYVRMSTDQQQQSIQQQLAHISAYAVATGCIVVQIYRDQGLSGLTARCRDGLQQLLADVSGGTPGFELLLVDDVSRWGRYQDVDEGAYYDFVCRRGGVEVVYCSESFPEQPVPFVHLLKDIKRIMAAEYSRQLSSKIYDAQLTLLQRGYKQGGAAGFGMQRVCLRADGSVRRRLQDGERKGHPTDRVVFAPASPNETAVVRRIFFLYSRNHLSQQQVADVLNQDGIAAADGAHWTMARVRGVLNHEKYCGNLTYNLTSSKLGLNKKKNDASRWVRCANTHASMVSVNEFHLALQERCMRSGLEREATLGKLREIYQRHGRLSSRLIDAEPGMPHRVLLKTMFGSLYQAYRQALPDDVMHKGVSLRKARIRSSILSLRERIVRCVELAGHEAHGTHRPYVLMIDGMLTLRISICSPRFRVWQWGWTVPVSASDTDFVLAALLTPESVEAEMYVLLDTSKFPQKDRWLTKVQQDIDGMIKAVSLEYLFGIDGDIPV